MSLFAELKRRNVFKVGIAYLVVGWLILQVSDVILNNIAAPDWVFGVIMLVVGIAFPVVLIFAWAFEMTPEGIKREHEVDRTQSITHETGRKLNTTILVVMALAIAYLLYDKFSGGSPASVSTPAVEATEVAATPETGPAPDSTTAVTKQSIAVLPFDNRSRLEEDEYFVEGVHDDLLTSLARVGSLKVISRTSMTKYKDTEKTIPEIAAELGVANIMEGAVQRSGDTVRINVQLIDAQTDEHLWAEIFDRKLTAENLFTIQSEISKAIADALEATLSPQEQQRISTMPTSNLAAYDAFQRGRQLMTRRTSTGLEAAIGELRAAVELDDQFALAWVALADAYFLLEVYGSLSPEESITFQEEAVERALAINPDLGEAHSSLAHIHEYYRRFDVAEQAYQRSVELSPNYATAWHWYSILTSNYPLRAEENVDLAQMAYELDPRSSIISLNLASAYGNRGQYNLQERQILKSIELDPAFARGHAAMGQVNVFNLGRMDEGMVHLQKALELDPGSAQYLTLLSSAYLGLGDEQASAAVLARLEDLVGDHWRPAFVGATHAARFGTVASLRETVNHALPKMDSVPFLSRVLANELLAKGEVNAAREIYLATQPGWISPEQWPELIGRDPGGACVMSWLLLNTGDEALGSDLLDQATVYLDETLPAVIEHTDDYYPEICYLTAGDTGKALDTLETQLAHNHLFGWDSWLQMPMFDLIRDEPRYQAVWTEYERRIAEQRERVAQMSLETGP